MGSGAAKYSRSEINMLEQGEASSKRQREHPTDSDQDDDVDIRDNTPETPQSTIEKCLKFFYFQEPSDTSSWAVKEASDVISAMSRICVMDTNKKDLSVEKSKEVASLCLNRDIPNLYLKYLKYIYDEMKEVFLEDEQTIRAMSNNNRNGKKSTNNNKGVVTERIKRFDQIFYAQKITCSMFMHMTNVADVDEITVQRYVKIGMVKLIVELMPAFYAVIEQYSKVVCPV